MSDKTKKLLDELNHQKHITDKHEEYMAKKEYVKKPKAVRRFEKYSNMAGSKDSSDEKSDGS